MKNTFGNNISVTLFGESHGPAVGAVLDGRCRMQRSAVEKTDPLALCMETAGGEILRRARQQPFPDGAGYGNRRSGR